jgi:hypothetical protein
VLSAVATQIGCPQILTEQLWGGQGSGTVGQRWLIQRRCLTMGIKMLLSSPGPPSEERKEGEGRKGEGNSWQDFSL